MASATQLRKLSKQQIGINLTGEAVPFSFDINGIDLRRAPLVCGQGSSSHGTEREV